MYVWLAGIGARGTWVRLDQIALVECEEAAMVVTLVGGRRITVTAEADWRELGHVLSGVTAMTPWTQPGVADARA